MSESDIDSLRRGYEAFNRRDIEGLPAFFDPDATWIPSSSAWGAGRAYHGHEGVVLLFEELERDWQEFQSLPQEFRQVGDLIPVLGYVRSARAEGVLGLRYMQGYLLYVGPEGVPASLRPLCM